MVGLGKFFYNNSQAVFWDACSLKLPNLEYFWKMGWLNENRVSDGADMNVVIIA